MHILWTGVGLSCSLFLEGQWLEKEREQGGYKGVVPPPPTHPSTLQCVMASRV